MRPSKYLPQSDIDSLHQATCLFELAKLRLKEKESDSRCGGKDVAAMLCNSQIDSLEWSSRPGANAFGISVRVDQNEKMG
jgi:hypothetical protein